MSKFDELVGIIKSCEEDANKIYLQGNSLAGKRLRKAMQEVKKVAKEVRVEVQGLRKGD